jgi:DNA mismatch repair protein MSH5
MLSQSTSKSLCLVDEFGKGTAPLDGMALVAAIIHHFTQTSTRVFFILHFYEVIHSQDS